MSGPITLADFEATGALLTGHFRLSSGLHSDRYLQCARLLMWPARAQSAGAALAQLLSEFELDLVVSPALGGLLIGHETAKALGTRFLFVERIDGGFALRRGFAIDTLFYAVILWLLFAGPFAFRRWRRIKRGLCPACAYPVGASDLCTECGKPVRALARMSVP